MTSNATQKSRRDFLKNTGRAAAVSALAGAVIPHCHAAESNTIRLALVGCGGRGTGAVMDAFASTGGPVKLFAMADLFEPRLKGSLDRITKAAPDKVDVTPDRCFLGFDGFKKAIDLLGRGDVVILTTPAVFRPVHFEYAVSKGVNVFMEKSFAVDAPGVRRMLASAAKSEAANLKVGAGFMWRHSAGREEAIKRIHDGMIGDLTSLRIYRVHGPVYCPKLPKDANELEFQLRQPMRFNWLSGGFFVDWHCHNVDVACWAKNAWPVTAQAMGGRCYAEAGNLFDHYTVEYTFPDGAKLYAFSRHMANCWQTYSDYAHGTKGSALLMAALGQPKTKIYKSQKMTDDQLLWAYEGNEPNPYHVEWQLLLDAIRQDKRHNEARRAAEADLVALMGRAAAHTGKETTWDQMMDSKFEFVSNIDAMTFESPAPIKAGADGIYAAPEPGRTIEV